MKTIIISLSLLLVLNANAQEKFYDIMPIEDGRVSYTIIVNTDSLTKDVLFSKIKDWAVDTYKSQKATLQSEDKEAGYIAYKGYLPTVAYYTGGILKGKRYTVNIYHTLKFYIKEGKYKIVFGDLETFSDNVTNAYLNKTDKYPIERWGQWGAKKVNKKHIEACKRDVTSMDKSIIALLNNVEERMKDKSAFEF